MLEESTLRRLYLEEQQSIRAIALLLHVPTRKVYDGLIRYRIPRRPAGYQHVRPSIAPPCFDEATLRQWYEAEGRTIRAIADLAHVSTRMVYDALRRYEIPRRVRGDRQLPPIPLGDGVLDAESLRTLYQDQGRSIAAIAAAALCSPARIRGALIRYQIRRRRRGRPASNKDR